MRPLLQPVKVVFEGDVPTEDIAEHFGWELGNVQQRVSSTFEFDQDPLVLSDLLVQNPYGLEIDLPATLPVSSRIRS